MANACVVSPIYVPLSMTKEKKEKTNPYHIFHYDRYFL